MRVAAVLWAGAIGGAETFTAELCRAMHALGAESGVVFITQSEPLAERLQKAGIPHATLELGRGREVIVHPRTLAKAVEKLGSDLALLPRGGYLAAALRAGGYRGRIVAVAHDATLELGPLSRVGRLVRRFDRFSGSWASDVDVAVSDFVLSRMQTQRRSGRLVRIHNGVDLDVYAGDVTPLRNGRAVTIGCAGRLVDGKGVDVLLRAFAALQSADEALLQIGGDGPARPMLERLARELGVSDAVEFTGWIADMPSFWRACDVAVMPSDRCIESFGMAAVEAMACARPVVVTENGALPELVGHGATGAVVPRGDADALRTALAHLVRDRESRCAAGLAARARCERCFDIRDCAASYLGLFGEAERTD